MTLINETSRHVRAFHSKIIADATELLKCQLIWVEGQTASKVKKIIFDGGRKYIKRETSLTVMGLISVLLTTTHVKKGCDEQLNRDIKNAARAMLIHSGAAANLWADHLYAVCKVQNRAVGERRSTTPLELFTAVKPTVAHLWTFGCKVWVPVLDKTR